MKDEYTILSLLFGAKDKSSEVFVWKLMGNNKHLAQVNIESVRKVRRDFCIIPAEGQDRTVQELLSGNSFIDLYIPESATLLRCLVKQTDAPYRYYLQFPEFIAQVERRKSLRLNVHESSEVKVSFGKIASFPKTMSQHFLKDCFDISSDGFSFFVSKLETKFFNPSEVIQNLEIKSDKWSSKACAEILAVKEIEPDEYNRLPYKVWRVSCKFSQIDQVSRKYLEKFIFERIKDELHAINE